MLNVSTLSISCALSPSWVSHVTVSKLVSHIHCRLYPP
jgi:hypothetical protein